MLKFEGTETSELVEMLMQYTSEYTLLLASRADDSDLAPLKLKLTALQNEINSRALQNSKSLSASSTELP